ncbi:YciI family protein [Chondromyces apiculatus]|nr:YciI family protein [Chondromyces apiculatus]
MQYMILIYDDESVWASMPEAQSQQLFGEYRAYTEEMTKAGVLRGGDALKPVSTATTVRVREGKTLTTDGPFAETKEQLGGYYIVEVPDLEAALKWAAKCPSAAIGSIEVRPVMDFSG